MFVFRQAVATAGREWIDVSTFVTICLVFYKNYVTKTGAIKLNRDGDYEWRIILGSATIPDVLEDGSKERRMVFQDKIRDLLSLKTERITLPKTKG